MDELLIEDKKYVSSKRAAKMTGYAKDYIGQLCREGRVSARLVGRSWYVLESAIQDHRFGDPVVVKGAVAPEKAEPAPAWESPRYEASTTESFPSVNRLYERPKPVVAEVAERTPATAQHLQETWQAWFDRFDHPVPPAPAEPVEIAKEEPAQSYKEPEQEPEAVPIRAIHHAAYQPPVVEEPSPRQEYREEAGEREEENREESTQPIENRYRGERSLVTRAVKLTGALVAVFMFIAMILGTGYFDKYIISISPARVLAGVLLYNR